MQPHTTAIVRASGRLTATGHRFMPPPSSSPSSPPSLAFTHAAEFEELEYRADTGGTIAGWALGCLGMREGEIRELLVPADEGYGAHGVPEWGIPQRAALNFTVELISVRETAT